jgi:hypothetical protein
MALTELQLPEKARFYRALQGAATEMDNLMTRWANLAEFVTLVDTADLDAMGVPVGQIRTDMIEFRTVLEEMVALYAGTATTPTNPPNEVIDKIRAIS